MTSIQYSKYNNKMVTSFLFNIKQIISSTHTIFMEFWVIVKQRWGGYTKSHKSLDHCACKVTTDNICSQAWNESWEVHESYDCGAKPTMVQSYHHGTKHTSHQPRFLGFRAWTWHNTRYLLECWAVLTFFFFLVEPMIPNFVIEL